ncbi:MAG: hypothetical protein IT529_21850 [Burkholderiales bacterium]|nr:hypothetical protein [Burkholderiales bacterium]
MKHVYSPLKTLLAAAALAAALLVAAILPVPPAAIAATPNVTPGAGQVVVIPFHISGQYTATTAAVVRFAMPFPCDVLGVGAAARASGGTSPTLTVDVLAGGTTILSAPIAVTAGAYAEGTVTTTAIADEAAMTVTLTIGGTSPTWNDITVLITVVRK